MSKELCISSTPHETRLAIVEDDQLTEIYYERENEYTLAGSIYKGRVTRVLPGMQSAFVDIGLERDAFLYVTDFLEEQGESADFEKPQQAGGRERQPQAPREGGREPREGGQRDNGRDNGRGQRQPREASPAGSFAIESADNEPIAKPEGAVASSAPAEEFEQGTRRFRGRRGRRRGFRGGQREGVGTPAPAASLTASTAPEDEFVDVGLTESPMDAESGFPISAAAEATYGAGGSLQALPSREGRGRNRGQGRHEGRNSGRGEGRSERAPRTEEFSMQDAADRQENAPPPTGKPIFLPGESLAKYGQKAAPILFEIEAIDRSDEKPLPVYTTAAPSTLVDEDALTWDGVSTALPGESLSKHRNRSSASAEVPEQTASTPVFAEPIGSFAEPAAADTAHAAPVVIDETPHAAQPDQHVADFTAASHGAEPVEADASHAAPIEILHAVHTPAGGVSFEEIHAGAAPQVHEEDVHAHQPPAIAPLHAEAAPAIEPVPLELEEVQAAETSEHGAEPEHASASYRVDPVAPSEFRLSSVVEEPVFAEPQQEAPVETPTAAHVDAASPVTLSEASDTSTWEWQVPSHGSSAEEGSQEIELPTLEHAPETSHDASPETSFEVAHGASHGAPHEAQNDTSFETSHVTEAAAGEILPSNAGADEHGMVEQSRTFSPGTGLLEEEVIDEDEYDFSPIHAHADEHDLEEIEEETLDSGLAGSELGDFVRDEHIKRRVMGDDADEDAEDANSEFSGDFSEDESESGAGDFTEADFTDGEESSEESFTEENYAARSTQDAGTEGHAGTQPAPRRDEHRRGGRDNGRDGGRGGRRGNNQRGRSGGGGHRQSAQTTDLPIISDLLKQGQEVLIQIAKEPIAKKGARITSHIALPGRFLVFMPTVNHVGVSRKISSDEERHRLKRILTSEKGTAPGGFIVRTAADGASEEELRADLRFLISLWTEIKTRSDSGKAPALIYHDLNLVERVLRDQVSDSFSTIWVDSEVEYERIVRFLNRFEPSLVRRVKLYTKETPLFEQFGIQEEISKALKSKVWLKSGGSIVINQTEALVAIDINTGKYVGKTARLEDTIVKTNLDAIPEIVRQIRLRDLGGIIIIDFIDMDERKNRHKVMAALEEELKSDRAPSKVLQFNDFGLVAITRKRVKQSLERTLSTQCNICAGTGMVKSPVTVCNEIYTELRKMMKHFERGDVLLRVNPEIVKTLKANNGKWLSELEEMIGRTIMIKSDPALHPEQFDIH
jgi:ribonuclease E